MILGDLPNIECKELMVGFGGSDDACVYRVDDNTAMIETVDFFTPVVNDPYDFGRIAAANALSDVYAMGGEPKVAMNLLCVPPELPPEVIREILKGGHSKAIEAGAVVAGGHSLQDKEPKYGMCVTGFAHPDGIWLNNGAHPGDLIVLTKPLGCGTLTTALKRGLLSEDSPEYKALVEHMAALNKKASLALKEAGGVHACTDITGFGLFGHGQEMAAGKVTLVIHASKLPLMDGALELARQDVFPGGQRRNRAYFSDDMAWDGVDEAMLNLCCDPQTSGGLMAALPPENAKKVTELYPGAVIIGEVREKEEVSIKLVP